MNNRHAARHVLLASFKGSSAADLQQARAALDDRRGRPTPAGAGAHRRGGCPERPGGRRASQAQRQAAQAAPAQLQTPTDAQLEQAQAALDAAVAQRQQVEVAQTNLEQAGAPPCAPTVSPLTGQKIVAPNDTACNEARAGARAAPGVE